MIRRIAHLAALFLVLTVSVTWAGQKRNPESVGAGIEPVTTGTYSGFDRIYREYGVEIITDTSRMIPDHWLASPIDGKASPIDSSLYGLATDYIEDALKEYPRRFLEKHLYSISLVDSLSFYDVPYGGTATYSFHGVIIQIKDWTNRDWFVDTIHHELNHLLVHHQDFPEYQWEATNAPGFKYGGGGVEAIRNGLSSTERTESAFRDGFANQYGKSAFVEDVATIVEYAIGDRADFLRRAAGYPIVARKYEILKQFYYSLDPWFDEDYWMGDVSMRDEDYTMNREPVRNNSMDTQKSNTAESGSPFKVTSMEFFETGRVDKRSTLFDADSATRIGYYIVFENSQRLDKTVSIKAVYFYPDGSEMGDFTIDYESGGYSSFYCHWTFGWDKPGYWDYGEYRVVLYLDGDYLTEGYFSVY
jgi:hypothetical protein